MRMLPVVLDDGPNRLLVDEAGHPIWPICRQSDMDLLAATANRVGSGLHVVAAQDADLQPIHRGVVASVEPDLTSEGRLYAHLTQRPFIALKDARQLSELENLEVVVCSSEAISSTLLHRLYDRQRPVSPGLVCGSTAAEIRTQVLLSSALAQLDAPGEGTYVQIWPDLGNDTEAERSWVTNAVKLDASVLAVLTHSDGLDAPLAKGVGRGNLLICPIRKPQPVASHRAPECVHSGWCHRVRLPVEEAFLQGELIEPEQFRARVLIWSTCFGLLDSGAPLDGRLSVVHQFNANPQVGVVLAKWRGAFGHGPLIAMLQRLAGGTTVGEAVAAFNATDGVLERGGQLAILGDPRVAAPFRDIDPGVGLFYLSAKSDHGADPNRASASSVGPGGQSLVALLRDCVSIPLRFSDEQQAAATAKERFEQAQSQLSCDATSSHCLAEMQQATLECFRRYNDVIRGWSPHVVAQKFAVGTACVHCGETKTQAVNDFAVPWSSRRIGTCPRCQIVEDSPAEFDLDFRVTDDRQLELVGTLPAGTFAGIIVVWSTRPMTGAVRRWPIADDGSPLRRIVLDVEWPRTTARVTVWMMFDLQFVTLNHRIQGAANPSMQS